MDFGAGSEIPLLSEQSHPRKKFFCFQNLWDTPLRFRGFCCWREQGTIAFAVTIGTKAAVNLSADRGKLHPRAELNKRNAWVSFLVESLQLCSSTTDLCRLTAVDFNAFQTKGLLDRGSLSFGARLVG